MSETCSVEFTIDLPVELAQDVEETRQTHPEFLGTAIRYALARRIVFDELTRTLEREASLSV